MKREKGILMEKLKKISENYLLKKLHQKAFKKTATDDKERIEVLEELIIQLYTLYQISKTLSVVTQLDEIFNESMDLIDSYLHVNEYCLLMLDKDKKELMVKACHGFDEGEVEDVSFKIGEGVSGEVVKTGKSILIKDVTRDKRYLHYKGKKKDVGSFLSIPLIIKNKEIIGVLNIHKKEINGISKDDVDLFTEIASDLANAIEKAKIYEETKELSMKDDLTSLHNRRYFNVNLNHEFLRAKRYDRIFSVIIIDIDNFKIYNDTNGHLKGDDALIKTAEILKSKIRKSDIIARYGGEEFILLLPEIGHKGAIKAAESLRKAVEDEKYYNEEALPLGLFTITAGVATYPGKAENTLDLINYADKALYTGKALGRNVVCG
jgi:diguanylate cyclase (GGDEF)-like protein